MEKLVMTVITCIIVVGIGVYLFKGDEGLAPTLVTGYSDLKKEVRSHGYSAN